MNKTNFAKFAVLLAIFVNLIIICLAEASARNPDLTVPIHLGVRFMAIASAILMVIIGLADSRLNDTSPMFSLSVAFVNVVTAVLWAISFDLIASSVVLTITTTFNTFFFLSTWTPPLKGKPDEN